MQTANTEILDRTADADGAELLHSAVETIPTQEVLSSKGKKPSKSKNSLTKQENLIGWAYIAPMVIGFCVFTIIPIVMSIISMFYDWSGAEGLFESEMIGFENFKNIFGGLDTKMYWRAIGNTLIFAIQLPVGMILGLFLALGMNRKMRLANTFRVIYYLPGVMSIVAVTLIWQSLFRANGTVNNLLGINFDWLNSDAGIAILVNVLQIWKGVGYTSLMFIAGLQSVSTDQLEAARIDGASNGKILVKIMLPALYPTLFYLLVTGLIGALQMFNEPYILAEKGAGFGAGDPDLGYNAMTAVGFVYYQKGEAAYGRAAVGAWVLALFIFIITAIQLYVDKRREKDY